MLKRELVATHNWKPMSLPLCQTQSNFLTGENWTFFTGRGSRAPKLAEL